MLTQHDIQWAILAPAVVALVVMLLSRLRPFRAAAPIAVGLAFLVAYGGIESETGWSLPKFPPVDATGWLPPIALAAMLLGLVDALTKFPNWIRMLAVFLVSGGLLGVLLQFKFRSGSWTPAHGVMILAGLAAITTIWWMTFDSAAAWDGICAMVIGWLKSVCVAIVIMMITDLGYGKRSLSLAAVCGAVGVSLLLPGANRALRGLAVVYAILMIALLGGGFYLFAMSPVLLALLASVPVFIWLGWLVPKRWKPFPRSVVRVIIVAIPLAAALALVAKQFQHDQHEDQDESGYYSQ